MKPTIVVEGRHDEALLKRLLDLSGMDVEIVAAGGRSSALSYARSLLAHRVAPIALVLDSETTERSFERDQERVVNDLLRNIGQASDFKVFFARPELESVFFFDPNALLEVIGSAPSSEILIEARYSPKHALQEWLAAARKPTEQAWLIEHVTPAIARRVSQHPLIQSLLAFLGEHKSSTRLKPAAG